MPEVGVCSACDQEGTLTPSGNMRKHRGTELSDGLYAPEVCEGTGKAPKLWERGLCPLCGRLVNKMLAGDMAGMVTKHNCLKEGVNALCAASLQEGIQLLTEGLGAVLVETATTAGQSTTSTPSTVDTTPPASKDSSTGPACTASESTSVASPPAMAATTAGSDTEPPSQEEYLTATKTRATPRKRQPLEGRAAEFAEGLKELFWRHQSSRPRSTQLTIGPSEVGHECLRRIAYKLSGQQQVNHSKDGWAAWVGTQGHAGLEEIFRDLNGNTGRFLIEHRVDLHSAVVPGGTLDLFDRRHGRVCDQKFPGKAALSKMHLDGPSVQYQTQLHTYGRGLELAGEDVREVCLIGWPRETGNLDELYVWIAPYDSQVGQKAIAQAEMIAAKLAGGARPWRAPKTPSFLCSFCPYYLQNAPTGEEGCHGQESD